MSSWRKLLIILSLLLLLLSLMPMTNPQIGDLIDPQENPEKNISFQIDVIPFLTLTENNNVFTFEWDNKPYKNTRFPPSYSFDLALMVNASADPSKPVVNDFETITFSSFLETSISAEENIIIQRENESYYEFGIVISNLEPELANRTESLYWVIQNPSFQVSQINIEHSDEFNSNPNETTIHLPLNLCLNFEDLKLYGFHVEYLNETCTKITGMKGLTEWNLDPIVYSSDIITVTGGSVGSPINFNDVYLADKNGNYTTQDRDNITAKDSAPVATDYPLRPADEKVLGGSGATDLYLNVTNWILMSSATILIYGFLRSGVYTSLTHVISSNETWPIAKEFVDINQTYIRNFMGIGSFDYEIFQGQWGVVWKQNDSVILDDVSLNIGDYDAYEDGYFADEDINVLIHGRLSKITVVWGDSGSYLRFGNLVKAAEKLTDHGVNIIHTYEGYATPLLIQSQTNCDVFLYSCHFLALENDGRIELAHDFQMYNSILDGVSLLASGGTPDVYRCCQSSYVTSYGIWTTTTLGLWEDLTIHSNEYALYNTWTFNPVIRNLRAYNNTYLISCYMTTGSVYLINPEVDNSSMYWGSPSTTGEVYFQFEFDFAVYFQDGDQTENANVTISNSYLGTSNSWLTYANGSIPQQIFGMGHYNYTGQNTLYDYNPYNLTVSLDGYETYTQLINITKKMDLQISLTPVERGEYIAVLLAASLILIPLLIVVLYLVTRRRS